VRAVELHRLLVSLRVEPIEEDARAAAHSGLAALERRPDDAASRRDVEPADVRLDFLTNTAAEGQILAHAEIVLQVHASLHLRNVDGRVADIPRERRRRAGAVGGEAGEGERPAGVAADGGVVAAALELHAGANRMTPGCDVEIVRDQEILDAARALDLGSAGVERVQDEDGGHSRFRSVCESLGAPLRAELVVHRLADRARDRAADQLLGSRLAVAALGQVEVADAEVVGERAVALHFRAEHLRLGQ
jgi:hypothetical protein